MKILGVCGSLRKNSSNWALLKAAETYFSKHEWIEFDLASLPYFDPDNQYSDSIPEVVLRARQLASMSDIIFISNLRNDLLVTFTHPIDN